MNFSEPLPKLTTAAVAAAVALIVPLYLVSPGTAVFAVKHLGYWGILGTVLLYLAYLWKPLRPLLTTRLWERLRPHLPALLVIAAATLFLHLHIERGFKILLDEHNLSSTAMSMHFENRVFVQAASHMLDDEVIASIGFIDKRPILFPFAVSVLHNLTGYRPENVFWLNSGLTFLLLALVYAVTVRTCGRLHGILAVLLFTSLPLLAQNTNGGGYELLNLCIICGLVLSSIRYLERPGAEGLGLVILHSVLLANTRYESILYVLVPALLFLLKSWRDRRISLTWFAAASPLLLILPLLTYRIFKSDPRFIQTTSDNFFNLIHLAPNLAHAITYLFEPTGDYSNSALLSAAGGLALLFLAVQLARHFPRFLREDTYLVAATAVLLPAAANTLLALSCYWGAWTDPATSRFSLPLQLFLVLAVPLALRYDFRLERPPKWAIPAAALFILGFTSPHTARVQNEPRLGTAVGYNWALDWAQANSSETNDLYLAESVLGFGLYRHAAIPFMVANEMPERVLLMQDLKVYDNIYALEAFGTRADGTFALQRNDEGINPRFIRQTVTKLAYKAGFFYRISRIERLEPPTPGSKTRPENLPPAPPEQGPALEGYEGYFFNALPLVPKPDEGHMNSRNN